MKKTIPGKKSKRVSVNKNLKGFEINIDSFGEIKSTMNIEKINRFLDENVEDKKVTDKGTKNKRKP